MIKVVLPVILSIFLVGCTQVGKIREGNDLVAKGLITAVCGMTVGAYYRLDNPLHKQGINVLCGANNQIELAEEK